MNIMLGFITIVILLIIVFLCVIAIKGITVTINAYNSGKPILSEKTDDDDLEPYGDEDDVFFT